MPRRSTVYDLPTEIRDALNARLVQQGFGGYSELAGWLDEQGYRLSRSAIHRYGTELEAEYEAAMGAVRRAKELARAYAADDTDDGLAMTAAMTGMAQEALLRVLFAVRQMDDNPSEMARQMSQISRAMADLGRLSIQHGKYAAEMKRQVASEAADRAEAAAAGRGVSPDGIAALRAAIMEGM